MFRTRGNDVEGVVVDRKETMYVFFFFKQKTAYEIGTGDWSSDVCSSDLSVIRFQVSNE